MHTVDILFVIVCTQRLQDGQSDLVGKGRREFGYSDNHEAADA